MITWIIEPGIFSDSDSRLIEAAKAQGHEIIRWDDDWLISRTFPHPANPFAVFHGSLGNAAQIGKITNWKPGAFCSTEKFYCSAWYPESQPWLLHKQWVNTTVSKFVSDPDPIFRELESTNSVFVRPDSPLKPFSGRVIERSNVSMKSLDYGYYYEDENLPIVVTPVRIIKKEWRFVVVTRQIVAGSAYIAEHRQESQSITSGKEWEYAQTVANHVNPPEDVYVVDVCASEGNYKLLELNPFSGADLYACDRTSIVKSISRLAGQAA